MPGVILPALYSSVHHSASQFYDVCSTFLPSDGRLILCVDLAQPQGLVVGPALVQMLLWRYVLDVYVCSVMSNSLRPHRL